MPSASWLSAESRRSAAVPRPSSASTRAASALASASRGGFGLGFGLVARAGLLAAVAQRLKLVGELLPLLLGAAKLRLGRFQRRLRDPPLGAHRRLSREQFGKRGFGFARSGFGGAEFGRDPRRMRFGIIEPRGDRLTVLSSSAAIARAASTFSASSRAMSLFKRRIESVEFRQPPRDRVAPRPRRRELVRERMAFLAEFASSALRCSVSACAARSWAACASAIAWWMRSTSSAAARASAVAASAALFGLRPSAHGEAAPRPREFGR